MTETWSIAQAAHNLRVAIIPFRAGPGVPRMSDGYSTTDPFSGLSALALRPDAKYKKAVAMHELGHILMGHTDHSQGRETFERNYPLYEVQAEMVALAVSEALHLGGEDASRMEMIGYIEHWGNILGRVPNAEEMEQVKKAATLIYFAGLVESE